MILSNQYECIDFIGHRCENRMANTSDEHGSSLKEEQTAEAEEWWKVNRWRIRVKASTDYWSIRLRIYWTPSNIFLIVTSSGIYEHPMFNLYVETNDSSMKWSPWNN